MANSDGNLIANNIYSSFLGHWVGIPAMGTADSMRLKLFSSTSVILLCKITKAEVVYIGQLENMGISFVLLPVLIDNCGRGYTITVKKVDFLSIFI